jgi:hypothetical protein
VVPEVERAPEQVRATATLEEPPKAKATEATRVATRPQAPVAEEQAAGKGMPEATEAAAGLETILARAMAGRTTVAGAVTTVPMETVEEEATMAGPAALDAQAAAA